MAPDAAVTAQLLLEGDWSALEFAQTLNAQSIEALTASLERLEPLPRVRLLLAALLLPRAKREELLEPLQVSAVPQLVAVMCHSWSLSSAAKYLRAYTVWQAVSM